ncbi:MAG: hypothetical protein EAZ55_11195 [Cytophagales bacterium]|nr:MAG: hypothetical protein EAZ55_11195 [Cytophagales bacterium]
MTAIIGIVLMGVAAGVWYLRQKSLDKAMNIKYHQTSKVADVMQSHKDIADSLGEGNFSMMVEVNGMAHADQPLQAEHSGRPALYYRAEVIREYEEVVETTDSEGRRKREVQRNSETISSNEAYVPFTLNDGSGSIKVDMEGAEKISQQGIDRFEAEAPAGYRFSGNSKTIGYRYREYIIPDGVKLYVLGEATDRRGGGLTIVKPSEKKENFIVSTKSEEELVRNVEGSAFAYKIGSIVSGVVGVVLLIAGILGLF